MMYYGQLLNIQCPKEEKMCFPDSVFSNLAHLQKQSFLFSKGASGPATQWCCKKWSPHECRPWAKFHPCQGLQLLDRKSRQDKCHQTSSSRVSCSRNRKEKRRNCQGSWFSTLFDHTLSQCLGFHNSQATPLRWIDCIPIFLGHNDVS